MSNKAELVLEGKTEPEALQGEVVQSIAVRPSQDISVARAPQKVLDEARLAAAALQDVISKKKNPVMMNGEQYLEFEDWQTLGRFYGVTAKVRSTSPLVMGQVMGFEASADAMRSDGMVISSADAMCMNDEDKWGMRPKYEWVDGKRNKTGEVPVPMFQLRSMAQTRACAKALRNVLAWVVVLAGYKPTPAEEVSGVGAENDGNTSSEPRCPECGKQGAIIEGKPEYGGGYLCFRKKGGCGAKFTKFPTTTETPDATEVPVEVSGQIAKDRINMAQAKLFWDTCKSMGKTKEQVNAFFGTIGIEQTMEMAAKDFPAAFKWAGEK